MAISLMLLKWNHSLCPLLWPDTPSKYMFILPIIFNLSVTVHRPVSLIFFLYMYSFEYNEYLFIISTTQISRVFITRFIANFSLVYIEHNTNVCDTCSSWQLICETNVDIGVTFCVSIKNVIVLFSVYYCFFIYYVFACILDQLYYFIDRESKCIKS